MSLADSFLNLLGYYNLSAEDYIATYGYDYYISSRLQLFERLEINDQILVDVISAEIAGLIADELETTSEQFEITYDFQSIFAANGTSVLQAERVMDRVLNDLETKGYKVYDTNSPTQFIIRWKFKKFRMFRRIAQ
jgi:hypothetical protein